MARNKRDSGDSAQPGMLDEVTLTPAPEIVVPVPSASSSTNFVEIILDEPAATEADIRLSAKQYAQVRGHRPLRSAGFLYEMATKFPGNRTRPEWDKLWGDFHSRLVG